MVYQTLPVPLVLICSKLAMILWPRHGSNYQPKANLTMIPSSLPQATLFIGANIQAIRSVTLMATQPCIHGIELEMDFLLHKSQEMKQDTITKILK